jgi:probable F420-dependent oxidoreductase
MPTLGLFATNMGACATADGSTQIGCLAEELGYDSLWMGEHVVAPSPRVPPSPQDPDYPILDPLVALAFMAAQTRRVLLATGIIILPQRNPLVLAKQLASLDVLSGGRLTVGIGVGYLEPEFRALGAPYEKRGAVTDDYLAAMRAIWTQPKPSYEGRFASFSDVQAHPQPAQRPLPIVIGGRSPAAFRRAVLQGNGWYGFALDVAKTKEAIEGLREAATRVDRPEHLGPLELSITPGRGVTVDAATCAQYAALGVHRLILVPSARLDVAGVERYVHSAAGVIGRV